MNHQTNKTLRNASCSTKKSSKNTSRSATSTKINLDHTLINMNNPSGFANNSTLTQRKSHLNCKGVFIDK